ncbi:hypothetical protein [Mobiluncus mulieris]|uniref:hypothetical protein n=1 Tax=Mobiluncus mulieris TaxID=2052 RepID=UPI0011C07F4F|nr:hypothetical protein [Mobiluncus mulieris]
MKKDKKKDKKTILVLNEQPPYGYITKKKNKKDKKTIGGNTNPRLKPPFPGGLLASRGPRQPSDAISSLRLEISPVGCVRRRGGNPPNSGRNRTDFGTTDF